jgi:hypothetical protein
METPVAVFKPPSVHHDVEEKPDPQYKQHCHSGLVGPESLKAAADFYGAHDAHYITRRAT